MVTLQLERVKRWAKGLLRRAPIGGHIFAKWDFVVENDSPIVDQREAWLRRSA